MNTKAIASSFERVSELTSHESERYVLAALITRPTEVLGWIADRVDGTDFYDTDIGRAFAVTQTLHDAGRPVTDPHLLLHAWKTQDVAPELTTSAYLVKLLHEYPNISHVVYHANLIRGFARKRRALTLAGDLSRRCFEVDDATDLFSWLDGECSALRQTATLGARRFTDLADDVISDLQKQVDAKSQPVLLSGLYAADEQGFVFAPGELSILAARPSVGKTTLAAQIAIHHAMHGRTVMFASLEMKAKEIVKRTLVAASGNNNHILRTCEIGQETVEDIRTAKDGIGDIPLYVWSPGRVKASQIQAMATVLDAAEDLKFLMVDYLGLCRAENARMERHEYIGEAAKILRDIAQRLDIPVLALCQLNRDSDKTNDRPRLSNLRDSGDIEQDADMVAFLHRDERTKENELIIAKNRQGSPGTVRLDFHATQTRFSCVSNEWTGNR